MSQHAFVLKPLLFAAALSVVGLASSAALADGTFGGNPPQLFHCGSGQVGPRDCPAATAEELADILLFPAPPGDDPAILDPQLWRCTPTTPSRVGRCDAATMADVILDLIVFHPSLGQEVRALLEAELGE